MVSEIYKSYINAGKNPPLYFYRDSNKKEIDLIIYQDGIVSPVEIKKGSAPKDAVKNFSVLNPIEEEAASEDVFSGTAHLKTKVGTGAVVCMPPDLIPVDQKTGMCRHGLFRRSWKMGHILYRRIPPAIKIYKTACGKMRGHNQGAWMQALFYIQATYGCEKELSK